MSNAGHKKATAVLRNCNNLNYEYSYSIQEHFRKFEPSLNDVLDQLIGEIEDILQRSTVKHQGDQQAQKDEMENLTGRLHRLEALHQKLSREP